MYFVFPKNNVVSMSIMSLFFVSYSQGIQREGVEFDSVNSITNSSCTITNDSPGDLDALKKFQKDQLQKKGAFSPEMEQNQNKASTNRPFIYAEQVAPILKFRELEEAIKRNLVKLHGFDSKPPANAEEAKRVLRQQVVIPLEYLPTRMVDYNDYYYFYGYYNWETKSNVDDIMHGYAFKKGESVVYYWSLSNTD